MSRMVQRLALFLACLLTAAAPALAQRPVTQRGAGQGSASQGTSAPAPTEQGLAVDLLVRRLEETLNAGDRDGFQALFDAVPQVLVDRYASDLLVPGAVKTVVRERDRADLEGAPAGDGNRLVVEFFVETAGRARILTAGLDVRRPPGGDAASWRIVRAEGLTAVEGLYRLRLNTTTQYAARNFEVTSEDVRFVLQDGTVFLVESDDGVTGLVLLGRGEMRFAPAPAAERGQLRIFSGAETLAAAFDSAFIRINPGDYNRRVTAAALTATTADARQARRAQDVFARESLKSLTLDLSDLSRDTWHLLPPADDFLAEMQTRRYGMLTFIAIDVRRRKTSRSSSATASGRLRSTRPPPRSPHAAASTATTCCASTTSSTTTSTRRSTRSASSSRGTRGWRSAPAPRCRR